MGIVQNRLIFQHFPSLLNALSVWGVKPPGRMLRATAGTDRPCALAFLRAEAPAESLLGARAQGRACAGAVPRYVHPSIGHRLVSPCQAVPGSATRPWGAGPGPTLSSAPGVGWFWNRCALG